MKIIVLTKPSRLGDCRAQTISSGCSPTIPKFSDRVSLFVEESANGLRFN
jgi:hypothetical protein